MQKIRNYILHEVAKRSLSAKDAKVLLAELDAVPKTEMQETNADFAIVGIGLNLPGAQTLDQYWNILTNGYVTISEFPDNRKKNTNLYMGDGVQYRKGGYLPEVDTFDAAFFNISPQEAERMDPSQRLFLQTAYSAFEDSGMDINAIKGSDTGVFVGHETNNIKEYFTALDPGDELAITGSHTGIMVSRISYILDLKGPAVAIDTACSSSLVALHFALQSLKSGECKQALVGGITLSMVPEIGGMVYESANNKVRAFDSQANGTVWSEGLVAILIKPLEHARQDNDHIYAVIKGSAINNDGATSSLTAPNSNSQAEVIQRCWEDAGIDPETVSYIETHGTGTALGDPIEIKGLTQAFIKYTDKKQFCGIGSVKNNIGHTVGCSGLASILKLVLALQYKKLPGSVGFTIPNELIDFVASPVYFNDRTVDWNPDCQIRRCGASAFGFSGTNVHILMEEAKDDSEIVSIRQDFLFTCSAKTEHVLLDQIVSYIKYLKDQPWTSLADFCYTASRARGQYPYRLAFIVNRKEQLAARLIELAGTALTDFHQPEKDIFYGFNPTIKMSSGQKNNKLNKGDIRRISKQANEFIKMNKESDDLGILRQICNLFISGATIDWKEFYSKEQYRSLSMPTYPFEKKRFWISSASGPKGGRKQIQASGRHPLLGDTTFTTRNRIVFESKLSVEDNWILQEHIVDGEHVIPGTAYIEMAIAAGRRLFDSPLITAQGMQIYSPLSVRPNRERVLQLVIETDQNDKTFEIISKASDAPMDSDEWILHVTGKYVMSSNEYSLEKLSIESLQQQCHNAVNLDEILLDGGIIAFGPRWNCIKGVQAGERQVLAQLQLPSGYLNDLKEYDLHPALLDCAISIGVHLFQHEEEDEGKVFLPVSYGKVRFINRLPSKVYAFLQLSNKKSTRETIKYNAYVLDESGECCLAIEDIIFKRISHSEHLPSVQPHYQYQVVFKEKEISDKNIVTVAGKDIVVIGGSQQLRTDFLTTYAGRYNEAVSVSFGERYVRESRTSFIVAHIQESYETLFAVMKNEFQISHIIHLGGMMAEDSATDLNDLEHRLSEGVFSLFYLTKPIVHHFAKNELEVVLISRNAYKVTGKENVILPENAALFGLAKALCREHSNIHCRLLDIDTSRFDDIYTLDIWGMHTNFLAAYRQSTRFIETLCKYEESGKDEFDIHADNVYLITGGTGDLGLEMARHIARKAKVTLVLASRSEFCQRELWDEIQSDQHHPVTKKINIIREIEGLGSTVYPIVMPMLDLHDTACAIDYIRSKFGRINGVIHCAGVAGEGFLFRKDMETFHEVIVPKIQGTWMLDYVTREDNLDFMVLFSSITSIFSGAGQGDYTAANAYMDSFAELRGKNQKTISLNWPAWREIGMAKRYQTDMEGIFNALSTKEALICFDNAMQVKESRIILGQLNHLKLPALLDEHVIDVDPDLLIEPVIGGLFRETEKIEISRAALELSGRTDASYSDAEGKVARILADVLSAEQINIYESFHDMGGNSILAIRFANALSEAYGVKMDISDIFDLLTVAEIAVFLDQQVNPRTVEEPVQAAKEEEQTHNLFGMQNHLWFLQKYSPESTVYQVPTFYFMNEDVDPEIVLATFKHLQQRHDVLGIVFEETGGIPKQRYSSGIRPMISFEDLSEENDNQTLVFTRMQEENDKLLNLQKPLWKVIVYKLGKQSYCLYLNIHHLITDGWSQGLILDQFLETYRLLAAKEPLAVSKEQYGYLEWIREEERHLQENDNIYSEYWLSELQLPLPILNLPFDYSVQDTPTYNGGAYTRKISREATTQINEFARACRTTTNNVLLAVYYVFLSKICAQDEIIVGIPLANRNDLKSEKVVGLLMNTVCIRISLAETGDFLGLIEMIKKKSRQVYKHGRYPFAELLNHLNPERRTNVNPVYQTMFQFYENHQISHDSSLFDLNFMGKEVDGEIELRMEYATDLFRAETINRFMTQYLTILNQIQNNQHKCINAIALMAKSEAEQLLSLYKNPHPIEAVSAVKKIEQMACLYPNAVAVEYLGETLTYGELIRKSEQLAFLLLKSGLKKEQPVAVLMERGIPMIISILAAVRAGAPYLPLDPEYPEERIQYMLRHSNTEIVLTSAESFARAGELNWENRVLIFADSLPDEADHSNEAAVHGLPVIDMQDLMYVIYTSGSTGLPKGVMVTHENVSNFVQWSLDQFRITASDRMMLVTSISFDISVFEIFAALTSGVTLYIVPQETLQDANEMFKFVCKHQISVWHSVPSLMKQFLLGSMLETEEAGLLHEVRTILLGGESWTSELAKSIKQQFPNAAIVNMYGPTEATIWITSYPVGTELYEDSYSIIPIGKPIWNNEVLILDSDGNICPVGIPGQIVLTGKNITKGYIHDREKTEQSFFWLEHFHSIGYKTGDTGIYTDKGYIAYLGRNDGMVKIRGYRVECGEIENVLQAYEPLKECVVIAVEDSGTNKLLCFYEALENSEGTDHVSQMKEQLKQRLPQYMMPAHFLEVNHLPKTNNGKMDRMQLRNSDWKKMLPDHFEQHEEINEVEKIIRDIWLSLLDYKTIGLHSNFFDVGGNSLLVSRMHYSIEQQYPGMITIAEIFSYPTIKKLAAHIMDNRNERDIPQENEHFDLDMSELFALVEKGQLSASSAANLLRKRSEG
ncbi:hypothetical protein PMSD_25195 [Paenibacillus macquariensis subsp. defensor]|nr:hypothetical protein PMSD_25195 [Paenibacillus macquariensis subsp. defensor]